MQKQSNQTLAKPLRKKGFPLFTEIGELVDGMCATGQYTFSAGQSACTPSTQNATASALTLYEPVIDPVLIEISL